MSRRAPRRRVVILISGRGSNMRALVEHSQAADAPYTVTRVYADRAQAAGLALAASLGIPTAVVAPATDAVTGAAFATTVAAEEPDLVVLAGFMRILKPAFLDRFAGRLMNIHPSLLPLFPGLRTHERALAAGLAEHGATVHYVTEVLDAGPAILQGRVPVLPGDDPAGLAARVQGVEHRIYPLAVRWHCEGRLEHRDGAAWLDGRALEGPLQFDALPGPLRPSAA